MTVALRVTSRSDVAPLLSDLANLEKQNRETIEATVTFPECGKSVLTAFPSGGSMHMWSSAALRSGGNSESAAATLLAVRFGLSLEVAEVCLSAGIAVPAEPAAKRHCAHASHALPVACQKHCDTCWVIQARGVSCGSFKVSAELISGATLIEKLLCSGGCKSDTAVADQYRQANAVAIEIASQVGAHNGIGLDTTFLFVHGLESARKQAAKDQANLGRSFDHLVLFVQIALTRTLPTARFFGTEQEALAVRRSLADLLDRRCVEMNFAWS